MRTDEEWIDLYESLHKNDMMWFALASMISAENFYLLDKEKKTSVYEQNIRYLTQIATENTSTLHTRQKRQYML